MAGCKGPTEVIERNEIDNAILIRSSDLSSEDIKKLDLEEDISIIFNVRTDPHSEAYLEDVATEHHVPMHHRDSPEKLHEATNTFLELMDTMREYLCLGAVLIHCQSGLHRTGVLVAIYRIEYQGWTNEEAYDEMVGKEHYYLTIHNLDGLKEFVKNYVKREDR